MALGRAYVSLSDVAIVPILATIWYILQRIGFPYIFISTIVGLIAYTYKHWDAFTSARIIQSLLFLVTRIFFREISYRGTHKIPETGAVVFVCAPHSNQFLDPLIVLQAVHREIGFLAAAKSMRRKYIGMMARALCAISVERAQDLAKGGKGKVWTSEKGKYIHGIGDTQFTNVLKPGYTIVVKGEALSVAQVKNDTELVTTGGTQLENDVDDKENGVKWAHAPKVDQAAVFENVWRHLGEKQSCVGIFPEGGSHDRSDMLPFKAGVTIMALGAEAKYPNLGVKIVPVGLNYFSGHRFRSRAYVDIGDPITIPKELVDAYKEGGQAKRDACTKLLEIIQQRLKTVTVTAPNHEVLQLIWAIRRLYKPDGMRLTTEQKLELTRRFEKMYEKLEDDKRIETLKQQVERYNSMLNAFGLRDHQVRRSTITVYNALPLFCWRLFLLLAYSIFALPGAILNAPIILTARFIAHKKAKEAKAASTVKLTGRDVLATWKVLVSLSLIPIVFIIYPLLAAMVGHCTGYGALRVWSYFALLQPFIMYGSVRFAEVGREIARSLIPLFYAIVSKGGIRELYEERRRLSQRIRDLAEEMGPSLFGSADEWARRRLIKPSEFNDVSYKTETGMRRNWSGLDFGETDSLRRGTDSEDDEERRKKFTFTSSPSTSSYSSSSSTPISSTGNGTSNSSAPSGVLPPPHPATPRNESASASQQNKNANINDKANGNADANSNSTDSHRNDNDSASSNDEARLFAQYQQQNEVRRQEGTVST